MGGRATTSRLLFAFAMLLAIIMTSQGVHAWCNSIALARHAYYAPSPSFAATTSVQRTSPSSLSTVQSPLSSKQISIFSSSSFALGVGNNNNNNNSYEELQSQLPSMGLNELQTQFRQAIAREDMDAAALYRNELADRVSSGAYRSNNNTEEEEEDVYRKRQRLSWAGLGTAPWLMERLQALEYPLPTTIQINAFEAVNAILADNNNNLNIATHDYSKNGADDDTLEERMQAQTPQNMGVVISGSTGR